MELRRSVRKIEMTWIELRIVFGLAAAGNRRKKPDHFYIYTTYNIASQKDRDNKPTKIRKKMVKHTLNREMYGGCSPRNPPLYREAHFMVHTSSIFGKERTAAGAMGGRSS